MSHRDKLRTAPTTKAYRDNHAAIFGPPKKLTPEEREAAAKSRAERHGIEAVEGRKDAQWYVDNEQRVSADPNYQKKPMPSLDYDRQFKEIFKK
ncbi:MAG: hypothetical protein H8E94_09465 [Alphaproteobacteria bacterium]|nr:hypothetical protein [Alphaproteobacteria bacterium]